MIIERKNQDQKGYADIKAGRTSESSVVFTGIRKKDIYDE